MSNILNEFIKEAKTLYGEKFSYEKAIYNGSGKKICITCKEHGDFWIIRRYILIDLEITNLYNDREQRILGFIKKGFYETVFL